MATIRLLTGSPTDALAIPRVKWNVGVYLPPLPRVTPSDADGGTSRRARTYAFCLCHFVDIKTHNAPRLPSVSVRIRSVGGSSSASRGRQQIDIRPPLHVLERALARGNTHTFIAE